MFEQGISEVTAVNADRQARFAHLLAAMSNSDRFPLYGANKEMFDQVAAAGPQEHLALPDREAIHKASENLANTPGASWLFEQDKHPVSLPSVRLAPKLAEPARRSFLSEVA